MIQAAIAALQSTGGAGAPKAAAEASASPDKKRIVIDTLLLVEDVFRIDNRLARAGGAAELGEHFAVGPRCAAVKDLYIGHLGRFVKATIKGMQAAFADPSATHP